MHLLVKFFNLNAANVTETQTLVWQDVDLKLVQCKIQFYIPERYCYIQTVYIVFVYKELEETDLSSFLFTLDADHKLDNVQFPLISRLTSFRDCFRRLMLQTCWKPRYLQTYSNELIHGNWVFVSTLQKKVRKPFSSPSKSCKSEKLVVITLRNRLWTLVWLLASTAGSGYMKCCT